MKSKLLIIAVLVALVGSVLAGCGGKGSSVSSTSELKPITLTELLENQMKENNGKVYIFEKMLTGGGTTVDSAIADGTMTAQYVWEYDGEVARELVSSKISTYGKFLADFSSLKIGESTNAKLYSYRFGDPLYTEVLLHVEDNGEVKLHKEVIRFWPKGLDPVTYHVEMDGESYIVIDSKERDAPGSHKVIIMKDTKYTKDKMVIRDEIDPSKEIKDDLGAYWSEIDIKGK